MKIKTIPAFMGAVLAISSINIYAQVGNTRLGVNALRNVTTGDFNTAIGYYSLFTDTSGSRNTATGAYSLYFNTSGFGNTADGYYALLNNRTGSYNKANGYYALYSNTTGWYNTGLGAYALYNNTTAYYNTATGSNSLYRNTTGRGNTANGYSSAYNNTTGNYNKADGYLALYNNTTGNYNTALGAFSMYRNTTASENTAMGYASLYSNTTGISNTAIGNYSLFFDTTGSYNTATGYYSLYNNRNGSYNKADGYRALYNNTTGWYNTAVGANALFNNTTASGNTATGNNSLNKNTTGAYNKAGGHAALFNNTTGYGNTAGGAFALYNNTTGNYNKADGYFALLNNTTGNYNTGIGAFADVTQGAFTNATAIGYNAKVNASNSVRIGNTSVVSIGGQVGWTTFSDGRFKKDIKEDVMGLEFINSLRPVTYMLDVKNLNTYYRKQQKEISNNEVLKLDGQEMLKGANEASAQIRKDISAARVQIKKDVEAANAKSINGSAPTFVPELKNDIEAPPSMEIASPQGGANPQQMVKGEDEVMTEEMKKAEEEAGKVLYTGFVAQEVEESAKKLNYDFSGVDKPLTKDGLYGLRYEAFIMPLVKAVQELSKQNADLQKQISELRSIVKLEGISNLQLSNAVIAQNVPNPFRKTTTISYVLPEKYSVAQIAITDKNGKILKQLNVSGSGKGMVNVDASSLSPGTYNYVLTVDGKSINSKQMVLIR